MRKLIPVLSIIITTVLMAGTALAQNSVATAANSTAARAQAGSLANLPEAETLVYVSPQRILRDAAPRVMSEADLAKMRSAFAEVKSQTGIDPLNINYVVLAIRFRKPAADLKLMPPDYMVVAGGDFSAEAVMLLVRQASQGKLREEKYGSKTLGLMTIDDIAKEAEKTPFLKSFSEVAIASVSGDTVAAGSAAYVKAAIDAADGKGRISADALNSLLRDPDALVSVAGSPMTSFAKTFALLGTETNPRAPKCDTKYGDFYAAVTMDSAAFKLRGTMNADNPDTAQIITNLLSGLFDYAKRQTKDQSAQTMMNNLTISAKESDIVLEANVPQRAVADFVREQMRPKPATSASPAKTTAKRPRRPIRRRALKPKS